MQNVLPTLEPKKVQLPNNEIIESTHEAMLPISGISKIAKDATIFPDLTSSSLLSIDQLYNDDCTAVFTKTNMKVYKNDNIILTGYRNHSDGLWDVPLSIDPTPTASINAIINKNQSKEKLAE